MYIAIRVITFFVIDIAIALLFDRLVPIWRKKERELEIENGAKQVVKTEWKKMSGMSLMLICAVIANLTAIVLIAIPDLLSKWLGFDVTLIAIIWWIVLVFDDIILYFLCVTATYDDETITVKKPFFKAKTYRFDDVIGYSPTGNLRIKTKTGSFTLFNAMSGTQALRSFLVRREIDNSEEEIG